MKTTKPNLCGKMMTDKSVRIVILLREFTRNGRDRSARINDKTIDIANFEYNTGFPVASGWIANPLFTRKRIK